jgi:hypothetical protein
MGMNVNLHIERLVLEGLPIDSHEGPLVQEAVRIELTRLLVRAQVPARVLSSGATPALNGVSIRAEPQASPSAWGGAIAQSVHGAIVT